jgi:hypothetical protein
LKLSTDLSTATRKLSPGDHAEIRTRLFPPPPDPYDEIDELVADIRPIQLRKRGETSRLLSILDELALEGGAL